MSLSLFNTKTGSTDSNNNKNNNNNNNNSDRTSSTNTIIDTNRTIKKQPLPVIKIRKSTKLQVQQKQQSIKITQHNTNSCLVGNNNNIGGASSRAIIKSAAASDIVQIPFRREPLNLSSSFVPIIQTTTLTTNKTKTHSVAVVRTPIEQILEVNDHRNYNQNNDDDYSNNIMDNDDDDEDFIISEIDSCETYIAILALLQQPSSTDTAICIAPLPVAVPSHQYPFLRGILECQILEYFLSTTTTTTTKNKPIGTKTTTSMYHNPRIIRQQLHFLQQQNVIKCIPIHNNINNNSFASAAAASYQPLFILTKDYVQYIQHYYEQLQYRNNIATNDDVSDNSNINSNITVAPVLLNWWIHQLESSNWIGSGTNNNPYIHTQHIESALSNEPPTLPISLLSSSSRTTTTTAPLIRTTNDMIQWLQDHQLILSAPASVSVSAYTTHHTMYQLWFPGSYWGTIVLPSLYRISKSIVLYIKRSHYKERSIVSILERFKEVRPTSINGPENTNVKQRSNFSMDRPSISIENVIIPYIIALKHVQRIERPSGMFLKLLT